VVFAEPNPDARLEPMRKSVLLLVLLAVAHSAHAAQRATVEELQQILNAEVEEHEKDGAIAHRLASVELTERLTEAKLEEMSAQAKPGPKTALALEMLADISSFLEPPANELPDKPRPDKATQQSMANGVVEFVLNTLHRLPDFLATRVTRSFDDSPPAIHDSAGAAIDIPTDLHFATSTSEKITYRNGQELLIASNGKTKPEEMMAQGLSSTGEFGPTLIAILADTQGRFVWSHWEQMRTGVAGVFRYEVPAGSSRYRLDYCCSTGTTDRNDGSNSYHGTPGYHGFLYVDPDTGAVMRYSLISELRDSDPVEHSAVWVEYGQVNIGGSNYLCPVRSEAIMQAWHTQGHSSPSRIVVSINEVRFTDYRRFGSTARILPATPETPAAP
jgi:hypothetical protein